MAPLHRRHGVPLRGRRTPALSVPVELRGAWRRVAYGWAGVRYEDAGTVVWLQSADWFADIRLPAAAGGPDARPADPTPDSGPAGLLVGAWAFAGVASWDSPRMQWAHHYDTRPGSPTDAPALDWDGPVLVERGSIAGADGPVDYVEWWDRLEEGDAAPAVVTDEHGVSVTSGAWRVTVSRSPSGLVHADLRRRSSGDWNLLGEVRSSRPEASAARPPLGGPS